MLDEALVESASFFRVGEMAKCSSLRPERDKHCLRGSHVGTKGESREMLKEKR